MRILVTGSAGFIGCWIARALAQHGHQVAGADSLVGGRNEIPGVPLFVGDLADPTFARYVAREVRPEILVHLAADPHEGASFYRLEYVTRNNILAYAAILEACIEAGSLRKIGLFSSMAVYGESRPPFTEAMEPRPIDPYGTSKAAMEALTQQAAKTYDIPYVVIRPHNVFGELQNCRDRLRNVVGIFINCALRGETIRIFGDGQQQRAFSYIGDSIDCYIAAIETDRAEGQVVNIGGEIPISIRELADAVCRHFSPAPGIECIPYRHGEVRYAYSDHTRAKALLGFEERIGWEEGLHRMVAWATAEGPQAWDPILLRTDSPHIPAHWKGAPLW